MTDEVPAGASPAGALRFAEPPDWTDWVSPGRTRNYLNDDPLLDWLERYGRDRGFASDDELPGYDPRTDFGVFILSQGLAFENGVMACLADELMQRGYEPPVRISSEAAHSRSADHANATVDAMRAGLPTIAQGVLWDPTLRVYGVADLLVRSDVLAALFPTDLAFDDAIGSGRGAPLLGLSDRHYRVVDIKFRGLSLRKDGSADSDSLAYMAQVWLYNRMLARISGYLAPAAYLLGRSWTQGSGAKFERGECCLERLARVDDERVVKRDGENVEVGALALEALDWIRRMRREGATWALFPVPSVPELYPHARHAMDQPWHGAKRVIAARLEELTTLPRVTPAARNRAIRDGITSWRDPRVAPEVFAISGESYVAQFRRVVEANHAATPTILPEGRLVGQDELWREAAPFECYADFETVSNLADDFSGLPRVGGQALIFQVGCGHWQPSAPGEGSGPGPRGEHWRFAQWTADRLDVAGERAVLTGWLDHLAERGRDAGVPVADGRVFHWSAAEPVNLSGSYNNARDRQPEIDWPADLPWYDLLVRVARAAPLGVTGAFGFGLKAIARGLYAQGHIATVWGDGPADGLGAMLGAWWCDAEATRVGGSMRDLPLMAEIGRYNEVDCRTMAEILDWLRRER
jgi:hypothetical protein